MERVESRADRDFCRRLLAAALVGGGLVVHTSSMTLSKSHRAIQMRPAPANHVNITDLAIQYSLPIISVHNNNNKHLHALAPRTFRTVPDLPAGWKAIFSKHVPGYNLPHRETPRPAGLATTTTIVPITISARQLSQFYLQCALAARKLDGDRWRWTIQIGQLALQLTSRNRQTALVTKELIMATTIMLNEFTKAGFTDLFFATLWHESVGLAVDVRLGVVGRAVEGWKVS
ncbi:MAG: hypothetical protein Q9177_003232 [Variospora cf. flavescens]